MKVFKIIVPAGTSVILEAESKEEIHNSIAKHNGTLSVGDGEYMLVKFPLYLPFNITEENT